MEGHAARDRFMGTAPSRLIHRQKVDEWLPRAGWEWESVVNGHRRSYEGMKKSSETNLQK